MTSTLGLSIGRVDGPAKVTGRARYSADFRVEGALFGAVLRSPHPHARIVRVDASRARAVPGVHAVLTGQDLGGRRYGRSVSDIPVLAHDRVRFIGEQVAAVAAIDRDTALEAAKLIEVEYEPLPAVFDPFDAMRPDAPVLHPEFREYRRDALRGGHDAADGWGMDRYPDLPNVVAYDTRERGDVEAGFRGSEIVLEHTYRTAIQHQGYIEPHACVVQALPDGRARIWASTKSPFATREVLARDLGVPEDSLIFEPTYVGGDFGAKGTPVQGLIAYFLSQVSGRPVHMVLDGVEEYTAAAPRHAAWITIKSGLKKDGTLVARHMKVVFSSGAYAGFKPVPPAKLSATSRMAGGVYRIPNQSFESLMVYTNHLPGGFMRAPGAVQVGFACEADIDRLAAAVGVDPLEFRLKNGVQNGDLGPFGERWVDIRLFECLDRVKEGVSWDSPKPRYVGRGLAVGQEGAGPGGSHTIVRVAEDGKVTLVTSVNDQGSGAFTILMQIVGHELQVPLDQISLKWTGTEDGPWDRGSSAQSVTRNAGGATMIAAQQVRSKLVAVAAEYLGCPEDQVELVDGVFRDRLRPENSLPFARVAAYACQDAEPVEGSYRLDTTTHDPATGFVAQAAEVEVDPETGQVVVRKIATATDVGTVLNPIGVTGQIEGATVMGLGFATTEELRLGDNGQVLTAGLSEYKLPTIADLPQTMLNYLITDAQGPGPYGAKAAAEMGHVRTAAAIVNAVYDAVGVRVDELPVTPERVYRALHSRGNTVRAAAAEAELVPA